MEDFRDAHSGRHYQALDDGRIRCDICPRECSLHDGQRGLCFVRARRGDEIVLTTYGRSSGFCIDPIEKKPLNHFLPGTAILSFGTAGCNLTCKFCQNHDTSKARSMDKLQAIATPQAIAKAALLSGCQSVAYTYNDPVIFLEYATDISQACHEYGIYNVAVTAGYIKPRAREDFFKNIDAVNLDIKAFSQKFYHQLCTAELANVLETAQYLVHERKNWLEITTLLIPDENDSPSEIEALCRWILDNLGEFVPIHFTAFHPDYKMLDKTRTPPQTLLNAWQIAHNMGLKYVYTGNIHHPPTATTYCPECKNSIIIRDWHSVNQYHIAQGGHCPHCGTIIHGFFGDKLGDWGAKRARLNIADFDHEVPNNALKTPITRSFEHNLPMKAKHIVKPIKLDLAQLLKIN